MSRREYDKGFTLEDLQAQRESIMATRREVGLWVGLNLPNGQPFAFTTERLPGWSSQQVGWFKLEPEPEPDQPTGRFQNLDFDE